MAINIADSFNVQAAIPLDIRTVVADQTAREALGAGVRYIGLKTYQLDTGTEWQLRGGVTNGDWVNVTGLAPLNSLVGATTGITAYATGGQANATALTKYLNVLSTVATDNDSVKLPVAVLGMEIIVVNNGAKKAKVFPATNGYIDDLAQNAGQDLDAATNIRFVADAAGTWKSAGGAGGGGKIYGVSSVIQSLANADPIALLGKSAEKVKVKSTGGAVNVTLPNGTIENQVVWVQGDDTDNPVTIVSTGNVKSNGDKQFLLGVVVGYMWDITNATWYEMGGY